MNIIKHTSAFVFRGIKSNSSLLAHHTILAEIELKPMDPLQQFSSMKLLHAPLAHVAKPHMP
ncbi:hypothetical protein LguiA_022320 [Lonicera macranthoides]